MNIDSLEFRAAFSRAEYLSTELELTEKLFAKYKEAFLKEIANQDPEIFQGKPTPAPDLEDEINNILNDELEVSDNKKISKEFKNLYKKIMTVIHPDKTLNFDSEKKDLYKSFSAMANSACDDEDWFSLFYIANKIDITKIDVTKDNIEWLKTYALNKEQEISSLKKSVAWTWFNSDENFKQILISKFLEKNNK